MGEARIAANSASRGRERPILFSGPMVRAILAGTKTQTRRAIRNPGRLDGLMLLGEEPAWCPFGGPGTKLWIRETFVLQQQVEDEPPPFTDGRPTTNTEDGRWLQPHYRATDIPPDLWYEGESDPACKWRPSIFMPRWASRITLEIASVQVERLQDISGGDVRAEGMEGDSRMSEVTLRGIFARGWDKINGHRPGAMWADSPLVWVLKFRRIEESAG